ncbi:hypothetical protein V492_04457 [Pseudogymnoascus sp. VKM F-4246]|nr:hypothetical protein V492_04457 [Pseudogymnoascus sp. VKM F-4246]
MVAFSKIAAAATFASLASAQTFQRLGACPDLGCVFPPNQADFLAGQYFDIRVEVHAPVNGSEANGGIPDKKFSLAIQKAGGSSTQVSKFFDITEPEVEEWKFQWYEDYFAEDAKTPSVVNVAAKAYRRVALYEPGEYTATLSYYNGSKTVANWVVRDLAEEKKAKNVILFIGDGMTTSMITAARLIGHKSINGKYLSKMAMDKFPILGHQMTHSIDSYITDSANSASALYSGHKSTVNAMGVYSDSSPDAFDDPKVETIVELISRIWGSAIGVVSTAFLADATPIALTAHTRTRGHYGPLVDQMLNGVTNYTWTPFNGPDVVFGGGAENFNEGEGSYLGKDYVQEFRNKGYKVVNDNTTLSNLTNTDRALGLFSISSLPVWLDRNVYKENIINSTNHPSGNKKPADDLPGLKEMTLKAVDILNERGGDRGFFLMSEAASIDKQMHVLDYDRALGDLLELDDTVAATIARLTELNILNNTLVIVTADHGHGFDVYGSADTKYMASIDDVRDKRSAIGTYQNSGLSQYQVTDAAISYNTGVNFPVNWEPRYCLAQGTVAFPDRRENYAVHDEPRLPATKGDDKSYYVNPADSLGGIIVNGTLGTNEAQGVHSLTDVPVYAMGPCQEKFQGTYNNIDIFFEMANCLGLARHDNKTGDKGDLLPGGGSGAIHTGASAAGMEVLNGGGIGAVLGVMVAAAVGAAVLV